MENAKLFRLIQVSDLEQHPVWEMILDDEADEDPSVFPIDSLPVASLDSRCVATRVRLANGTQRWAMLHNVRLTDPRKTEHLMQLSMERDGEWFWLARYWDADAERNGPTALAKFLGLPVDEVFPIQYDLTGTVTGSPAVVSGQINREPTERLSQDEIIKIIVR